MVYYNSDTIIYSNGLFMKAIHASADPYSQSLHYGYGVFEGIRSYRTGTGDTRIYKAKEHYDRLQASAKALNMLYTYTTSQLIGITCELLEKNRLQDAYIRPLLYAPANMGFHPNSHSSLMIMAWQMAPFWGENPLRVGLSSFERPNAKAFPLHAKVCGHYVNSILSSQEVKAKGYDEALLLDNDGYIAEGPGANIFIEKDGRLYTPPPGKILAGITRASVLELCRELQMPVAERPLSPEELYAADSAFFCGTAVEIVGIESINNQSFPVAWETTLGYQLQQAFRKKVREQETVKPNETILI